MDAAKDCAEKMYANDRASKSLGIEIEIPEAGSAIASMYVRQEMVNGFDIIKGKSNCYPQVFHSDEIKQFPSSLALQLPNMG